MNLVIGLVIVAVAVLLICKASTFLVAAPTDVRPPAAQPPSSTPRDEPLSTGPPPASSGPQRTGAGDRTATDPPPQRTNGWDLRDASIPAGSTSGDWVGAMGAVLAGLGAMFVLAVLGLLLLAPRGLSTVTTGQVITFAAVAVALAVGGSITVDDVAGLGLTGTASVAGIPVTLTVVGFAVLAAVFALRLRARGVPDLTAAALQAARVWVVMLGALLAVCLVGRAQVGGGSGIAVGPFGSPGLRLAAGTVSTVFFGSFWLAVSLAVATMWRLPALLPPPVRAWRDRNAGPLVGAAVAVTLASVAALLLACAYALRSFDPSAAVPPSALVGLLLLAGPNLLLVLFGFSVGVPLVVPSSLGLGVAGLGVGTSSSVSLLDVTDREPTLWLLPILAAAAVTAGGIVAALHAPSPGEAQRSFWRFGVAMSVVLLLIAVSTAVSGRGAVVVVGLHLDFVAAPLLGLMWGALGGWVGAVLGSRMPQALVDAARGHVVRAQRVAYGRPARTGRSPRPPIVAQARWGDGRA